MSTFRKRPFNEDIQNPQKPSLMNSNTKTTIQHNPNMRQDRPAIRNPYKKPIIIREENMTSVRQIIDLTQDDNIFSTQDDDIDDYGTLADDSFLTIEIPMSQEKSQKPKRIIRNLY